MPDEPTPSTSPPAPFRLRSTDPRSAPIERIVVRCAIKVIATIFLVFVGAELAWRLRALLLLVAVALFIAALLHPLARALERRGLGRTAAVLVVYVTLVVGAAGTLFLIFHPVYSSATRFASDLPTLVRQAEEGKGEVGHLVTRFHLLKYVKTNTASLKHALTQLGKPALAVGKTVVSGVVSLVTIAFISLFVLLEAPAIFNNAMRFVSDGRETMIRRSVARVNNQVTGFMLGNFATSVIAGVVVYVSLSITGVPFASVLAIWLGIVDFLPLIGGLLGGVPAIAVAFLHSVTAGIVTVVLFLVYQQIENHFLNPLIISRTVRLNPLWVLVAVLFGAEIGSFVGSTFGAIAGAIFAVPFAGSLQVAMSEFLAARQARIDEGDN